MIEPRALDQLQPHGLAAIFPIEEWKATWTVIARNRLALVGLVIILGSFTLAVIGPTVYPYDPRQPNTANRLQAPNLEHPFGTDRVGRDILARIIEGLRITLIVATGATVLGFIVGTPLGAISGYYGRWVDAVVMRFMDAIIAFPSRLLAIAMVATMGASLVALWIAIAVTSVPRYARIIRGGMLAHKEREYVYAARLSGEGSRRIMANEIFPNIMGALLVQFSIDFATAILTETSLSFLGLGLAPPTISWGMMLSEAGGYMELAPWTAIFPGLAISALMLGFNLFGDGLRDVYDPRQYRR